MSVCLDVPKVVVNFPGNHKFFITLNSINMLCAMHEFSVHVWFLPPSLATWTPPARRTRHGLCNMVNSLITTLRELLSSEWVRFTIVFWLSKLNSAFFSHLQIANSSTIPCCMPNGGFIDKNLVHPECFPIEIPRGDTFFSRFGQRCMPLVRSAPGRRPDCSLGCAEQVRT